MLIVQSKPSARARLSRILMTLGYADGNIVCVGDIAQPKDVAGSHRLKMVPIDLGLPRGDGVQLISWLHSIDKSVPILVVSACSIEEKVLDAICAGASGYLLRERDDPGMTMLLKTVSKGSAPIDPYVVPHILRFLNDSNGNRATSKPEISQELSNDLLSKRELAILTRVAEGMSNREIADILNISQWTVDTHIRHIYGKLAVNSRMQAVQVARRLGLPF